jgi:ATP-binding cassette subfamily B protein
VQDAVSVEKFFEIIQMRPRIQDAKAAVYLPVVINEIKLRNVSFGYQVGKAVLKDLDFNIPADKWIGIVGASGSGKTTLISLILRLYDPWQGEILLDSLDLRRIRLDSLRAKITIATQEPFLFDFSIKENISCGLGDITDESIREAGQITQLDDYVKQLPKGYDTLIGEDACRLSQGLKQRVALARAVVRESALLILDEATSSIDSATEERIFTVLRQKRKERGTVIVSHRLFSIKDADRIFYLRQDGKVESGSHEELLVKSNFYREFFHNQLGVPSAVERLY